MFEKVIPLFSSVIDTLAKVHDNVWAFLLFLLAGAMALVAHYGHDAELMHFGSLITATASAIMHSSKKADT